MGSAFSRAQAANARNNASTAILRSALSNYINATKNMNANKIRAALNNKKIGLTESYKNRIANAVANAVIKARKANVAVAAANAGAVSEIVAAAHVNNAANKLANLNKYMNTLSSYTNNKNKVNQYIASKRNLKANSALNAGRNGGPKYANFFAFVRRPIGIARPNSNILNSVTVRRFLNNHKNNQNNTRNQAARSLVNQFKGKNFSTLNLANLTNAQTNILERAIKLSRNNSAATQAPAANSVNNFRPANNNINASNKKLGYKLIANTPGNYMKVKRNSNNSQNWSRVNNKVYTKINGGGFKEKN
jgi:hypothetical protein